VGIGDAVIARSTEAFIQENPADFEFVRPRWEATPAGGRRKVEPPLILAPQKGRFVESGLKGDNSVRTMPGGRLVNVTATIVLHLGADVEPWDEVEYRGQRYQVATVGGRYAVNAEVARYAEG
jgi:hypothetical protein